MAGEVTNSRADPLRNLIAGGFSGFLSLAVGHPFDTIKVRLQTMKPVYCERAGRSMLPYAGAWDCFRQAVRTDGLLSLYRGMYALTLFSVPRFSLLFYSNSWGRILGDKMEKFASKSSTSATTLDSRCVTSVEAPQSNASLVPALPVACTMETDNTAKYFPAVDFPRATSTASVEMSTAKSSTSQNSHAATNINSSVTKTKEFSTLQILFGGVFSQIIVCPLIVNPIERVKVLLQTSNEYKGQIDCLQQLVRREGLQGLLRGTTLTLGRDIPSFCTYFLVYEGLREYWKEQRGDLNLATTAFIGGLAGMAGWALAIPLDNLKNRHQVCMGRGGVLDTFRTVVRESGFKQLYRGSTVIMVRAFPANAATFVGYEWTIQLLDLAR